MQITNRVQPSAAQVEAFFGAAEDGPFVMVNLLKFKPRAEYADGSSAALTGAQAYMRYGMAVGALVKGVGGRIGYAGPVTALMLGEIDQADELWDMVALAEYPSLAAMREMVMSPAYQALAVHRIAGLAGQLNIKTRGTLG